MIRLERAVMSTSDSIFTMVRTELQHINLSLFIFLCTVIDRQAPNVFPNCSNGLRRSSSQTSL